MKDPYMMMTLLILGVRSSGNEIDVYLEPLIVELKDMWNHSVRMYDALTWSYFQMHATLCWIGNDFIAYGNLLGWGTKGNLTYPNYNYQTIYKHLRHGS